MNLRPRTWRRWLVTLGLLVAAVGLSGCVYLRLLALKRQLGDFDRHFALQTTDGLRLTCLHPVLLSDDVRWLGILPEKVTTLRQAEQWHVHWVKQVSANTHEPEPAAHDIEIQIDFVEKKLTGFFIAERYFAFIPKSFVIGVVRGLGTAGINKHERSLNAKISLTDSDPSQGRPTIASLAELLGRPTEQRTEGEQILVRYRYLPPTAGSNNGDFDLLFRFSTATGELLHLEGQAPVGKISLDFEAANVAAPADAETSPGTPAAKP
jgi:hypothetical protein